MSEKTLIDSTLTEENVVRKVTELLETLEQVKKYNALAKAFKKFALIIVGSIVVFLAAGASIGFLNLVVSLNRPELLLFSVLLLLIPIGGIVVGILFIQKRLSSIKPKDWKDELSCGFPSALKILLEIDWDETFDEISSGRAGYALYGVLKVVAYWIVAFFGLGLLSNSITYAAFHRVDVIGGPLLGPISLLIVYLFLRKDLSRRYNEIRALDKLLWELRWFSVELRRAEFKT